MCLDAVELDDELLDRIAGGHPVGVDELTRWFVGWRHEIRTMPVGELVSVDEALEVIQSHK